jgi:O-antigen/teichoic acid export membrane protein
MIGNSILERGRSRAAFSMLMLYAGKTSGILVNLVFLPIYSLKLGPEEFGIVAVILSLQALLMMLDLGVSTVVGRDVAANEASPGELLRQIFSAELGLVLFYGVLMLAIGICFLAGFNFGIGAFAALGVVVMIMLLVLQNLHYNAIIARRAYAAASALQLVGNLTRASGTAFFLAYVSPTLTAFIVSQLVGALLQASASRYLCVREFKNASYRHEPVVSETYIRSMVALLHRARPLALLSAAGAAVTQLDKPIISYFMSPSSVAPYFLAMTYCMVPMAVLAPPVAQFFQPLVINAALAGGGKSAFRTMRIFTISLVGITLLPSAALYFLSDTLVGVWLHRGPLVEQTLGYIQILLPGLAIGALGYIPYSLLLASSDYKFMAILSTCMTVITLLIAIIAASQQSVLAVCVTYAIYHAGSTVLQWVRASGKPEIKALARSSSKLALLVILLIALVEITRQNLGDS